MEKYYVINIDNLEITYHADCGTREYLTTHDHIDLKDIWLQRKMSRHYYNEFEIWCYDYNETKGLYSRMVGYLNFESPNPHRGEIYINYCNEALYSDFIIGARFYLEEVLNLKFLRISKLDIAADFNFNIQRYILKSYKDLDYELLINGEVVNESCVHGVGVYAGNNPRNRLFAKPSLDFANKNKTLTMRVYDKLKEIKEESNKTYILERDGFTRIYRVEMTCKNHKVLYKSLVRLGLSDEDLYSMLDDHNVLQKLFTDLMNRLVRLRKNRTVYNLLYHAIKDLE